VVARLAASTQASGRQVLKHLSNDLNDCEKLSEIKHLSNDLNDFEKLSEKKLFWVSRHGKER
jgi:hypothetical protein